MDILHSQLDDQALLMLHLAGELPDEERAALESRLAVEPALGAELESLRRLQEGVLADLAVLDGPAQVGGGEGSVHRVMSALRRHRLELLARPMVLPARAAHRRLAVFGYGVLAAAAAITLALGLWGLGMWDTPPTGVALSGDLVAEETTDSTTDDLFPGSLIPRLAESDARLEDAAAQAGALETQSSDVSLLVMEERG